ncbi:Uncharacterised protein [Vibrio cholerae]|nr:Uncharacterised protein [Vibrio cholerae]CSC49399.1 Uncharacterised protein [Vibrio cholerae]
MFALPPNAATRSPASSLPLDADLSALSSSRPGVFRLRARITNVNTT